MNSINVIISSDLFQYFEKNINKKVQKYFNLFWVNFNNKPKNYIDLLKNAKCIVSRVDLSDEEWCNATNLKLLQIPIAGYDGIDLNRAYKKGVYVCNNGGANAVSVSEHTFLLMLSLYRHFLFHIDAIKKGPWINKKYENLELCGKTLGIIGLGKCGKEVAKRAKHFNMNVIYYDILRASSSFEENYSLKYLPFSQVLKKSDIVTLHVPLTTKTKHLFNNDTFKLMKSSAHLINTSRGAVINENSLVNALKNNLIKGAALDVFEIEPLPKTSELLNLNNVILTPHCAPSYETMIKTSKLILDNIISVYNNKEPDAQVIDYEHLKKNKVKL